MRLRRAGGGRVRPGASEPDQHDGPIADLLSSAAANLALYEGRGWDESKILARVSAMDRAAVALAYAILPLARPQEPHSLRPSRPGESQPN